MGVWQQFNSTINYIYKANEDEGDEVMKYYDRRRR